MAILAIGAAAGCGGGGSGPAAADAPHFVADDAGIDHRYEGDFQYFVGGGVAAFDCDDDGRSELFFAGGSAPAALYHNDSPTGGALGLHAAWRRRSPIWRRSPAPIRSTSTAMATPTSRCCAPVRTRSSADSVAAASNRPARHSASMTPTRGRSPSSATWEASDELPTLAFGGYLAPDRQSCADGRLLRPAATGDGYAPAVALSPGYCTLSMLFSDWSRSGRRDLRMTNDRHYYRDGSDQLWRIVPGEAPRLYTAADGWRPLQVWGMGIASEDVTGDGYPDVFLTSQGDNKLQTLADGPGQPTYEDIALSRGATAHRPFTGGDVLPSTAWHDQFADVNNDGVADLFIAKGNVDAEPGYATRDPSNLLIGQRRRHVRGRRRGRRDRQLRAGARWRPRRPQPRRDARPRRRAPHRAGRAVAQRRPRRCRTARADGLVGRHPPPPADGQRRRHRRVGRDPGRRPHHRPRGHGRRRSRQRPARLDPPRSRTRRPRRRSASSGPTARPARG